MKSENSKMRHKESKEQFPFLIVLLAPFLAGLFYEAFSAVVSVLLIAGLFIYWKKNGKLVVRGSLTFWATAVLLFSYLAVSLWAVDPAMNLLGIVKFLPMLLFVIACEQAGDEAKQKAFLLFPYSAAVMTVLTFLLGLIPSLRVYFYVGVRLAGFFEYPNTFAMYLLLGIPCLLETKKWTVKEVLCTVILLAGILLSGSRAVLLIMALMVLIYVFRVKSKVTRVALPSIFGLLIVGAVLYALISGDRETIGRILTLSFESSTMNGRLLYYFDAARTILTHPFGLGYMGYYFIQGSIQTGVYSIVHIHNDLLQFLLDVGWIPAGLFAYAVIRSFIKADFTRRVMILLLCLHSLMDFDLQFVAMDLLLLLMMDHSGKKKYVLKSAAVPAAGVLLAVFSIYFGIAAGLYQYNRDAEAVAMFPGHTLAQLNMLTTDTDAVTMNRRADSIISHNKSASLAWSAKARVAMAKGDVAHMMEYKPEAIRLAKYRLEEYLDYADMLWQGKTLYEKAGNLSGAQQCQAELHRIPIWIQETLDGTSVLGWRIYDKPELELPAEYAWLKEQ